MGLRPRVPVDSLVPLLQVVTIATASVLQRIASKAHLLARPLPHLRRVRSGKCLLSRSIREPRLRGPVPGLTAEELFDFFEALPAVENVGSPHALDNARAWSGDHREAVDSYPMRWIIRELLLAASTDRARRISLPMAGTYRLELTLPNGSVRVLFARTVDRSTEPYTEIHRTKRSSRPSAWDDPSIGFELWFFTATAAESLPTKWVLHPVASQDPLPMRASWPWHIAWVPEASKAGVRWPASIDPFQFMPLRPREPVMDSLFQHHERWFDEHWHAGTLPQWFGWFTLGPAGSIHFEEPIPMGDAGILMVRGDRISPTTVADSLPW